MTNFLRITFFLAAVCVLGVFAGAQAPIPHVFQAGGIISATR